ncbi:MAG TPA: CaiB/BaiF CoA-transferase family protein [Acidimicrobiales bacterium]|nr:CaiB/BaiF CoA-transferase family protein [Acidimicrobiales bacterium]
MRLGDIANAEFVDRGKPLDGVRVLSFEQMQALPFATQLLARLGADVVKVESPTGDLGRTSQPTITDPAGRTVGATFLRNNLGKRSLCVDLKRERGRQLVLELAPGFDVVADNFKHGAMDALGLGYGDFAAVNPAVIHVSVSGFGTTDADGTASPYAGWPAMAPIVEAMSGIYEMRRGGDDPPVVAPVGGLGDLSAALFATVGVLAALRDRDRTGEGQRVDVAMLDATVAMTDIVPNFWSMGLVGGDVGRLILDGFRAADGWFILQVAREQHFAKLVEFIGHPEWVSDPRFATRQGWVDHLEDVLRPAIEGWAASRGKLDACRQLAAAGIPAGPCFDQEELVHDPHLAARDMLVEMPRPDGVDQPVLTPGNPVRLSKVSRGPETRVPWLGEHTGEVLRKELRLSDEELDALRAEGVIM